MFRTHRGKIADSAVRHPIRLTQDKDNRDSDKGEYCPDNSTVGNILFIDPFR